MKSRNVRRRSGGSRRFTIAGGLFSLILLVVSIGLGWQLAESRQENEDLRGRLSSDENPSDGEPSGASEEHRAELTALEDALSTMNGELELLHEQSSQEREQVLRESAKERETLTSGIAEVLSQVGISRKDLEPLLANLPAGDRLRILEKITVPELATPVGAEEPLTTDGQPIPPPDEKPEEERPVALESKPVEGSGDAAGEGEPKARPATEEPAKEDELEYVTYTIKRGDTLSQIARQFDVGVAETMKLNGIADARKLGIGQVLKIPQN